MNIDKSYQLPNISPKALRNLLLFVGLAAIAFTIIKQQIAVALAIVALPLGIYMIGYGLVNPRFIYLLYATYSFFFTTISRYAHVNQLSAGLDAIIFYGIISLIFLSYYKKGSVNWNNAINILTISYIPWMFMALIQLSNPGTDSGGIFLGIRVWIFRTFCLYVFLSVLSNTNKALHIGLNSIAFFTILAFIKLAWQKYIGFDSAELHWLFAEGGAVTHIIGTGVRYFSYFTDAANFGCFMGAASLLYGIIGFHKEWGKAKILYLSVAFLAFLSMFISGTRGALIIPVIGLMLYTLLCKRFKIIIITASTGILFFSFFAFTNIGNGNEYIRRARSAFHKSEDASMNVRLQNRKEIAQYIANHPLGAGIEGSIAKLWLNEDGTYTLGTLPSDSFFVQIWIQTGTYGLVIYILICGIIIIEGCRIVMFKIKDKLLQQTMAAFTCATLGFWASGYTGNNPGMPPTDFVIVAMMAFVMNGTTIDKEIEQKKLLASKTSNAI